MGTSVTVPCSQLLKNIHVPNLNVIVRTELITESSKKPVLVEIIIYNLLTCVDVHFIIQNEGPAFRSKGVFGQGERGKKVIPHSPVKIMPVRQFIIAFNLSPEPFFEPDILHQPYLLIVSMPL